MAVLGSGELVCLSLSVAPALECFELTFKVHVHWQKCLQLRTVNMPPLLALAYLGSTAEIEIILCMLHHTRKKRQAWVTYSQSVIGDTFANVHEP